MAYRPRRESQSVSAKAAALLEETFWGKGWKEAGSRASGGFPGIASFGAGMDYGVYEGWKEKNRLLCVLGFRVSKLTRIHPWCTGVEVSG